MNLPDGDSCSQETPDTAFSNVVHRLFRFLEPLLEDKAARQDGELELTLCLESSGHRDEIRRVGKNFKDFVHLKDAEKCSAEYFGFLGQQRERFSVY